MKSKSKKAAPKIEGKDVLAAAKATKPSSPFETKAPKGDMQPEGTTAKRRMDRPGRKLGGRVGADTAPLSSAAKTTRC
jgi:hypothetical protein